MKLTVACAQIAPAKGQISKNLDTIAETILQASGEGADLVVFPETATSGYLVESGVLELSLRADQLAQELGSRLSGKLNKTADAIVGYYENDGGILYNSAAYIEFSSDGPIVKGNYRKFFLASYGVFDDERFVTRGEHLGAFDTRFGRVGILICEDVWHTITSTLTALDGAQIIAVISASPGRGFAGEDVGNHDRYRRMVRSVSEEHGVFSINTQLTGFEGGKGFVGGSMIFGPTGELLAESPVQEEHLLLADLDLDLVNIARSNLPLIADLKSSWSVVRKVIGA